MPVEFKDYYAILGVPREATADQLKKAFRKLARIYHPDVAKDKKTAEAKFKEINEAYEVLGDPKKKTRYDQMGARWQDPDPPPRASGARPGGAGSNRDFHFGGSTGFSDFFEQYFGQSGRYNSRFDEEDGDQNGFGRSDGQDIEGEILVTLDEVVHGTERTISLQRTDPRTGQPEAESFKVRIPPGAEEGRRIRVKGKGGRGAGKGASGDLFLRVRVAAHPDFRVQGIDLYYDLDLAPWEAVLGTSIMMPTLTGKIRLRIPAGTKQGQQFRVRGQGLPKGQSKDRGDLYGIVVIQLPDEVSEKERALWEQLGQASNFNPRAS